MLEVPIQNRRGEVISSFLIDEEDAHLLQYKWRLRKDGYVYRGENRQKLFLHREILNNINLEGKVIDHINGNPRDNRRCNLRVCEQGDNAKNIRVKSNNTSGVTGVNWVSREEMWRAYIKHNGKFCSLGYYANKEDAIKARKEAEVKYFGEFRRKD